MKGRGYLKKYQCCMLQTVLDSSGIRFKRLDYQMGKVEMLSIDTLLYYFFHEVFEFKNRKQICSH